MMPPLSIVYGILVVGYVAVDRQRLAVPVARVIIIDINNINSSLREIITPFSRPYGHIEALIIGDLWGRAP